MVNVSPLILPVWVFVPVRPSVAIAQWFVSSALTIPPTVGTLRSVEREEHGERRVMRGWTCRGGVHRRWSHRRWNSRGPPPETRQRVVGGTHRGRNTCIRVNNLRMRVSTSASWDAKGVGGARPSSQSRRRPSTPMPSKCHHVRVRIDHRSTTHLPHRSRNLCGRGLPIGARPAQIQHSPGQRV